MPSLHNSVAGRGGEIFTEHVGEGQFADTPDLSSRKRAKWHLVDCLGNGHLISIENMSSPSLPETKLALWLERAHRINTAKGLSFIHPSAHAARFSASWI